MITQCLTPNLKWGRNFQVIVLAYDILYGEEGNDTLYGFIGGDTLYGGAGDDSFYDAGGNSFFVGGEGNDTFDFDYGSYWDVDTIDFNNAGIENDTIRLNNAMGFTNLPLGTLASTAYIYGTNPTTLALNSDHHIIYDNNNGTLFYDANGSIGGFNNSNPICYFTNTATTAVDAANLYNDIIVY